MVPSYLTFTPCWTSLWPLPLAALLIAGLGFIAAWPKQGKHELFLVMSAFAMLGLVIGYLTGMSRVPAIGAVLPAVLSLLAGLSVFMMGKDSAVRVLVSLGILVFSLSLALGSTWGAVSRRESEEYLKTPKYLNKLADWEQEVRAYRQEKGLPETPLREHAQEPNK